MALTQRLEELRDDVTFAIRQLRRAPAFTCVAALTLALGIGANSAMFALVDATLLRPLPFRDPERLVVIWERSETTPRGRATPVDILDWRERNRSFDVIAGLVPGLGGGMVLAGADGSAETVPRQWVTAEFFDVVGVSAIAGRTFLPTDDDMQRPTAVVVSEGIWRTRFGGDPSLVGREIRLDGELYTVVGVAPRDFQLQGPSGIWALMPSIRPANSRGPRNLQVIGRLKAGVTLESAGADMASVADGLARELPAIKKGRGITLEPMRAVLIGGDLRLTSLLFLGVVAFVLLICCANVTNLLLARATIRARELAVRSALGAGRSRIVRQLLTESLVLAALGGVLGAGIGAAILQVAPVVIPQGLLPGAVQLTFDGRVVAFCVAAALLVGLLFGLAPTWHATGISAAGALASDSRTSTGRGGRLRGLLVVGEVATAVVLLFGASLLLRTLIAVATVDRGYRADSVLTMVVDPLGSQYPTPASLLQFLRAVEQEALAVPGVQSVAWASTLPMGPSQLGQFSFEIVGEPPLDENRRPTADFQIVSGSYFDTIDLPLVIGRGFTEYDTRQSVQVCIVNEAFVQRHLQGRSPIGARVAIRQAPTATPVIKEIVGVARQVKARADETDDLMQIYVPYTQAGVDDIYLIVRPRSGRADALASAVRGAIARVDRQQLVSVRDVMTLDDVAREGTARHRFRAVMVVTFAGLALLLAMVGVFGILAYSVQQRVRELGVRIALGASLIDVLGLVVGGAARLIAAGAIVGLSAAALLSRLLSSVLFGVQPLDPVTFAAVTVVLALTAAVATAAPAWRASRIDPAVALRNQ
jgi:putative ABC transport system permease protein